MVPPIVSGAAALLFVISVSVITANPVPRAAITPPAETADPVVTTERITTTASAAAAITTTLVDQPTTQDIPVQPTTGAALSENRTEPPSPQQQQQESESDKEPSKGLVSFDQRQHGRFNIRADLDNFMIILLPQSTTKSPLLSLGGLGSFGSGGGGSGSSSSAFGSVPGSSLFDLFTRKASTKRYNNGSRRKYKVKSAMKRKYKEMLKKQAAREAAEAEEKEAKEVIAVQANDEQQQQQQTVAAVTASGNNSEEQPLKKFDSDFVAKDEIEERTSSGSGSAAFEKSIQDKYRMDTLEKIQHQLDILIKRVDARETFFEQRPHKDYIEGRTPYRVEIGSLTNDPEPRVDILPSPQNPIPFRQFRTDQALQIGNHGPQPKFFQPWTFPSTAAGDNPMNPFGQRQPVMVAFRDGRSLGPQPKGNDLRSNSILALPFNSLGLARAMDVVGEESNEVSPVFSPLSPFPLPNLTDTNTQISHDEEEAADAADLENPYLNEGFIDLTDTLHSFDSLNVDNDDKMIDTPTAQFNQDWDLKLLGATDDCGPDRRRDSYGICQFVQF